ncbi:SDR family NAD(P)-dependent oxidoreductase [Crocosphaera sp.]|uniref:SDR family NAD(P)-dependent oxidoreductase n=1 Tax=Crocosphaera sp. TaxID=2729996 RepID=UPI00261D41F4|nr:SDR family NAD(P)-dependent oxidoreductase [Crocosphaera sp.]MDJ0581661.1 SDR family NAD(P)-dependent oxidoreductase [Crocosphaera sp.]
MTNLKGKVALVTGATRGIGKGIAIGLGEAGATVYITGRTLNSDKSSEFGVRSSEFGDVISDNLSGSLLETEKAVNEAGGNCIAVQVDHSDDEQVRLLFERINKEQNGQLDILVNNVFSGVQAISNASGKPFWKHDPSLWDTINNVGLRSHYVASIFAARLMSERQQGLIFTISSWGGLSYIFGAAYGVGKAACDRLAADMAVELKADNITSISLWPGIVGTEQMLKFFPQINERDDSKSENANFGDYYNWETPLFTGRVIAALAAEKNTIKSTGKVQIIAELAKRYKIVDEKDNRPVSLRSLRFILANAIPALKQYAFLIPDIYIPWFILQLTMVKSPKI